MILQRRLTRTATMVAAAILVMLGATTCGGGDSTGPTQPTPTGLVRVSGDGQAAAVGQALSNPLVVKVVDGSGAGVEGISITWTVTGGGGSASPLSGTTDAAGLVSASWTLGPVTGANGVTASASGRATIPAVTFSATAVAGPPAKLAFTVLPSAVAAGAAISPAVQVVVQDAQGNPVTGATTSVTLAITSGTGTSGAVLGGTVTVAAVSGVATFANLTVDKVGTGYSLTATATSLTSVTSAVFNVTPGAATKLAFTVLPSGVVAGAAISPAVQVTVQDAQGNTVTGATTSVTLAITSGTGTSGAVLGGTLTVAAVNGVATLANLTVDKIGTGFTLTATAAGLTSATSIAFAVAPSTGVRLAVTSPRAASRWYVVADSGALTSPQVARFPGNNRRADTLLVPLPVGSGYRLRLAVADSASTSPDYRPLVTAGGQVSGVSVFAGSLAPQSIVATSLTATVAMPDTVAASGAVPIELTLTDPSQVLSAPLGFGHLHSGATSWETDIPFGFAGVPFASLSTFTSVSSTTVKYAGVAIAPSSVGTMFSQIWIDTDVGGQLFGFWVPSRQLGQPLRTTAVVTATTGVRLAVTSPRAASRWYVVADSGGLTSPQVARFPGNNRRVDTLLVSLPAGAGYRLRLVVADSASTSPDALPLVTAGGHVSEVSVVAGSLAPQAIAATALTATVTMPDTVAASGTVPIELTLTDPSQVLTATDQGAQLHLGTASWATDGGSGEYGYLGARTTLSPTTVRYTGSAIAPSAAGTLYSQLQIYNGVSGQGFQFFVPSRQLGQPLRATVVVVGGQAAKLAFTAQLSAATAGAAITPAVQVTVQDAQGNAVTSATTSVTLALTSGTGTSGAVLGGTLTVAAVNGVATFADLTVDKVGTGYTFGATAAGLASATSAPFNVTPSTGVRLAVTSPRAASRWYVVADSGGLTSPQVARFPGNNRRADTLLVSLPAGSGYRLRLAVADSASTSPDDRPLVTAGGQASGVSVFADSLAPQSIEATALTATVTKQDTVAASGAVPIELTLTDPSQVLVAEAFCAVEHSGATSWDTDVEFGLAGETFTSLCTVTALSGTTKKYAGVGIAPSSTGTMFSQIRITAAIGGQLFYFWLPSRQLDQPLRTTAVVTATTGVRLAVTSPRAASRWYVVADSGSLTSRQVARFPGNNRRADTLLVSLPAGSGYRLRLAVCDSASTNPDLAPLVTAGGQASGVSVVAGSLAPHSIAATVLTATVTMPDTVAASGSVPVELTLTDPSQTLAETAQFAQLRSGPTSWEADGGGTDIGYLVVRTVLSPTTFRYSGSAVAPSVAGTLYSQLQIDNRVPGGLGFLFFVPSRQLGQPLRTTVVVVGGQATKLAFTAQPSAATSGAAIAPAVRVTVQDAQGNAVTSATTSVTVALTSGTGTSGAVLGGTLTVAAVNGVATFSTLTVDKAGTGYTLTAAATSLTSATSTPFDVIVGGATQLVLTTPAAGSVSGAAFITQPVVAVRDAAGNTVTTDNATVVTMAVSVGGTMVGAATKTAVAGVAGFSGVGISGVAGTTYTLTFTSVPALTPATQTIVPSAQVGGSLSVTIQGLPGGVAAHVVVTGPGGFTRDMTATGTLSNLDSGTYTVTASAVATSTVGWGYVPTPATQSVVLLAGATMNLFFTYASAAVLRITVALGDSQVGYAGSALPVFPTVIVTDPAGAPQAGVTVDFLAVGGTVQVTRAATGADGIAAAGVWTLGSALGTQQLQAVIVGSNPAIEVTFTAQSVPFEGIRRPAVSQERGVRP